MIHPTINATLNAASAVFLLVAYRAIRRLEIGFRSTPRADSAARAFARGYTLVGPRDPVPQRGTVGFGYRKEKIAEESFLVTGDENIIDLAFTVQYHVKDPVAFAFDAFTFFVSFLALVAMSRTRAVMGARQGFLRELREGVAFVFSLPWLWVTIAIFGVVNTEEVHAAFRDVASAQEDRILIIDRATTFAQEAVNLADGEAAAMVESALAFKEQRILQAEGDARAFSLRERAYRRSPDLTTFRLHMEALEEVLPKTQKILRPGRKDLREFDLWLLEPPGVRRTP